MAKDDNKPSIFQKAIDAGHAFLDQQIKKSHAEVLFKATAENEDSFEDLVFAKTITEDPSYAIHSSGWKDKPYRLQDGHLKSMSKRDSIVAAVIQTRQNQVSNFSQYVMNEKSQGWTLKLKNEDTLLEEIKERLKKESNTEAIDDTKTDDSSNTEINATDAEISTETETQAKENNDAKVEDDTAEEYDWELQRRAEAELEKKYKKAREALKEFIINCGKQENRPFNTKKWNLDSAMRTWVRDSLTYDLYATELVYQNDGNLHHFFPTDGSTIKYASPKLKNYKETSENFFNLDILFPEKEAVARENASNLQLDSKKLEDGEYRYVQVIRGKVERAYLEREMKIGIRNKTTDIYNNGYGISELELCISLITGHLNAEYYNQAYFTQGFSAKGILHIKSALNRRKVESVRQQWHHMISGSKNSFRTPIFAGVDDVQWIPLTQNHNDIGFEGWMRYLVKMTCAIYQIDPSEIGIGLKDEGSAGISGDNTEAKINQSKDRGLFPLLRHIQNYVNTEILANVNSDFEFVFTGLSGESATESVDRQASEVKFKKTVNEIRAEDGLPPLPGMDDIILDPQYMAWYTAFSPKAEEKAKKDAERMMQQDPFGMDGEGDGEDYDFSNIESRERDAITSDFEEPEETKVEKSLKKSKSVKKQPKKFKIEYYTSED